MMSESLRARIMKAIEFDEEILEDNPHNEVVGHENLKAHVKAALELGVHCENARLRPILEAVAELIDAAIPIRNYQIVNCAHDCRYEGRHPNCRECNALTKLEALLPKEGGE